MNAFKQCLINDTDILLDGMHGIYYTRKDWRRLDVDDRSEDIQWVHKRSVTPTYARKRIITLEWYIDGLWNDHEQEAIAHLEKIFALQSDTSKLIPHTLTITDMFDQSWILEVKVKTPLDIVSAVDDFDWYARKWRVVLESVESPVYRSLDEFEIVWEDGVFGGMNIGTSIPFSLSSYTNILELSTNSNQASPIRREIQVVNTITGPLSITDLTTWKQFKLTTGGVPGDILVIDAEHLTATKNGKSIIASRVSGSYWLTVHGTKQFLVSDANGALPTDDLEVYVYFRNSLL